MKEGEIVQARRSVSLILLASAAVAAVAALGVASAHGSSGSAPMHGPPPPPTCSTVVENNASRVVKEKGCAELGPSPLWSPPVGAVDSRDGHVVRVGENIVGPACGCAGFSTFLVNGKPMTADTVDFLRLPDGRVRLFVPDIGQIQTGVAKAAPLAGGRPIIGEVEVAPAPLARFPVRGGDNSLGWATATG